MQAVFSGLLRGCSRPGGGVPGWLRLGGAEGGMCTLRWGYPAFAKHMAVVKLSVGGCISVEARVWRRFSDSLLRLLFSYFCLLVFHAMLQPHGTVSEFHSPPPRIEDQHAITWQSTGATDPSQTRYKMRTPNECCLNILVCFVSSKTLWCRLNITCCVDQHAKKCLSP